MPVPFNYDFVGDRSRDNFCTVHGYNKKTVAIEIAHQHEAKFIVKLIPIRITFHNIMPMFGMHQNLIE